MISEGYPTVRKGCAGVRQQACIGQYPTVSVHVSSSPVSVRKISSLFFLIPSFGQGGVRKMFSFLSFSFLFMRVLFVAVSGDSVTVSRFALQYPGFLQQHPEGWSVRFPHPAADSSRRNMTAAAAFKIKELPLNVGGSQDAVTFVERESEKPYSTNR